MLNKQLITRKIVYIVGHFPALSETFVQQEILELEHQGMQVQIFSLFKLPKTQGAKVLWVGKATHTCISQYSWLFLLMNAIQYFLRVPICFTRTCVTMLVHYRLRLLIGCRILLFACFLAAKFEHEDIVHLHAHFASESASVAQFTCLLTGIPYSFTAHANDIYLSSKVDLAFRMKMARFVVTISAYNQKYLASLVDENIAKRIYCIYNGLNFQNFPSPPYNTPVAQTFPLIVSVCRLVEKKGLVYLLHACRILVDQGHQFVCYIIGDGPQRQELEQKVRELNLSNRVVLLGAQTHKQVTEVYQKATIMVLPCIITQNGDRDGIPTVLIESLYASIPSVSTTVSGIPELISSEINGLLVPPNDSSALAIAMARLLDDPSLRFRLANAGHRTIVERFDLSRNVEHIVSLFQLDSGEQMS